MKLVAKLTLDSSDYEKGLGDAKDKANKGGGLIASGLKTIGRVGAVALTAATTGMVAFGKSAVEAGKTFDASMSQVAATMGMSAEEMHDTTTEVGQDFKRLRDFAQEMGRTTKFSATESADALNYMALAGYSVDESIAMLPNVLSLAAAGNMDLARASDMVTDTQTAFGMEAERTSQMVDEMAKAASTGNTSVEQLGEAFLVVGGLAKELNGGFVELADGTKAPVDGIQEMEIMLTAMANAGVKGSEAGTHMRNMLMKLSNPTKDGIEQMEKLGIKVWDAEGNMRSMRDIMGDLNTSLGNLTQEKKIQAIGDLFNARDLASAEALLAAIESDWDEIGEAILDADGAAKTMAETQLDNLAGDITLFQSALEGAKIAVSDVLSPSIREFVQFGTDGISRLTAAFQSEEGLSGAMRVFGELLSELANKIVEKLPDFIKGGMELLSALGQGIIDNLPLIIDTAVTVINEFVTWIVNSLPTIIQAGLDILVGLAQGIVENLPTLIPTIVDVVIEIVDILTNPDTLSLLIDASIAIIMALATGLIDALPRLMEKAPEIIANLVKALIENVPKLLLAAAQMIAMLLEGIGKGLVKMWNAGKEIVMKFIAGIWEHNQRVTQKGRELIDTVKNAIKQKIQDAVNWGKDLIQNFINGITAKWNALKEKVSGLARTVKSFLGFSEPEEGPLSDFHTYAPDMMMLFAKGIKDNEDKVKDQLAKSFNFDNTLSSLEVSGVGSPGRGGYGNNYEINVTVNGSAGQSVAELANLVAERISFEIQRREAALA